MITVPVALLISGISLSLAVYMGITNLRRNQKNDDKKEASEATVVIVGIENIKDIVKDIKSDVSNINVEMKIQGERQIRTEESLKSAWKRIEVLETNLCQVRILQP